MIFTGLQDDLMLIRAWKSETSGSEYFSESKKKTPIDPSFDPLRRTNGTWKGFGLA